MYLKKPYGLDILIPETKSLNEHYQFIRDNRMNIVGGVYIQSHETTRRARETYLNILSTATRVKGKEGEGIIRKLKKELREKYGG